MLRLPLFCRGLSLAAAATLISAATRADELAPAPGPDSPVTSPDTGEAAALAVRVETTPEVTEADFLAALFRTLRRPLLIGASAEAKSDRSQLTIRYDGARRELVVTCYEPSHGAVTRVIEPPADPLRVPEAAALLADNLCTVQVDAPPRQTLPVVAAAPVPRESPAKASPTPPPAPKSKEAPAPRPHEAAVAGAFYPFATNYERPNVRTNFEFNLIYGRVGQLDGIGIGLVNSVEGDADGLIIGGILNRVGGRVSGLSLGGVNAFGSLDTGVAIAALVNHAGGAVRGGQAAFGLNFSASMWGVQAAGLMNVASGRVDGLQTAFGANVAEEIAGAQLAPLVNVAGDVEGVQVGLVNIGGNVRGMQIGLVNVAEEVDGVPIGFVNVTESGGVHVALWGGYTTRANVGLKFATRYTYSMLTAGHYRTGERDAFGPGVLLGVRVPASDKLAVAFDIGGDYLFGTRFCCYRDKTEERQAHTRDRNHFRFRVLPTWQFKPRFSLFAGGGVALKVPFARYSNLAGYDQAVELEPELAVGVEL